MITSFASALYRYGFYCDDQLIIRYIVLKEKSESSSFINLSVIGNKIVVFVAFFRISSLSLELKKLSSF